MYVCDCMRLHACNPAEVCKQNQGTCRDRKLMHVCKRFSEKLCVGSLVLTCMCVFAWVVYVCERGKGWQRARWNGDFCRWLNTFLILLPNHPWQTALAFGKGEAGREEEKKRSGDKSRGGHLDAANIASVMQHVCVTSNVTFTWCSHPCVILRYGGVTVTVLISYRLSPSQHKRLAMEKCYHLSDYKKKMSGDNKINRACKIWINGSL